MSRHTDWDSWPWDGHRTQAREDARRGRRDYDLYDPCGSGRQEAYYEEHRREERRMEDEYYDRIREERRAEELRAAELAELRRAAYEREMYEQAVVEPDAEPHEEPDHTSRELDEVDLNE